MQWGGGAVLVRFHMCRPPASFPKWFSIRRPVLFCLGWAARNASRRQRRQRRWCLTRHSAVGWRRKRLTEEGGRIFSDVIDAGVNWGKHVPTRRRDVTTPPGLPPSTWPPAVNNCWLFFRKIVTEIIISDQYWLIGFFWAFFSYFSDFLKRRCDVTGCHRVWRHS